MISNSYESLGKLRVNLDVKCVMIYRLEGVKYGKPEYLTENDTLESKALEGLKIDLFEVWA